LDFSLDLDNRYTFWSGIIGGTFLSLSYFGTDQSQVQRYLSGRSVKQSQMGMIMNGFLKVPMQFFILFVGVMVFVFYQFNFSPLHFNPLAQESIENSIHYSEYQELEKEQLDNFERKQDLIQTFLTANEVEKESIKIQLQANDQTDKELREKAKALLKASNSSIESNDKDYVFIHFVLNHLPKGIVGLILAMALSAAMSSTASELNALGTTTTIDLYKRNIQGKSEGHYLKMSKVFTFMWGVLAILFASVANLFDNLIQLVNIIGSIFYGNVLGIFLLAFFFKYIRGHAVFIAAIITQIIVVWVWWLDKIPYLWLNLLGCLLVILLASIIQIFFKNKSEVDPIDNIGE